jgi:hypothetical protein
MSGINSCFQKMRRAYRNTFYGAETGFLMNYLTLHISNKEIRDQLMKHRAD